MAIDLSENGNGYNDLIKHIGHKIVIVGYCQGVEPVNVAIECEDCGVVLVDFDKPDLELPDGISLREASKPKTNKA